MDEEPRGYGDDEPDQDEPPITPVANGTPKTEVNESKHAKNNAQQEISKLISGLLAIRVWVSPKIGKGWKLVTSPESTNLIMAIATVAIAFFHCSHLSRRCERLRGYSETHHGC